MKLYGVGDFTAAIPALAKTAEAKKKILELFHDLEEAIIEDHRNSITATCDDCGEQFKPLAETEGGVMYRLMYAGVERNKCERCFGAWWDRSDSGKGKHKTEEDTKMD